jgi:glucuronosyltransferase
MAWLPQSDLLGHPNTKLFINHCGNGGQYDAITHGIPMIGFPHLGDQWRNAQRVVKHGLGFAMDILDFTSEDLLANIKELLNNPIFKSNAELRAAILADQPLKPEQTAAYWIEHVIQFGGSHLKSYCLDMPHYQFYMLDILGVLFAICIVFILITFCTVRVIVRQCKQKFKQD